MSTPESTRAGRYVSQGTYLAYYPEPLPPRSPELRIDGALTNLLADASYAIGSLQNMSQLLPNRDLFLDNYVRKEALLSSQIEGTQASLIEVIDVGRAQSEDVEQVTNYVNALNYGLKRLREDEFPMSLRLIREVHEKLLASGRGSDPSHTPGEFRRSQNWIGAPGSTLQNAAFVPPPVEQMRDAMGELENFMHAESELHPLVRIALIHAQFETIHPFLDGNGRMGRLLITLWLCDQGILNDPVLYLSYFFKRNRAEYYDRLMAVRFQGKWEEWVAFFLTGIIEISRETNTSIQAVHELREDLAYRVDYAFPRNSGYARRLLDQLFIRPRTTRAGVQKLVGCSAPTAGNLVEKFDNLGILKDADPDRRINKRYEFRPYLDILEEGTE